MADQEHPGSARPAPRRRRPRPTLKGQSRREFLTKAAAAGAGAAALYVAPQITTVKPKPAYAQATPTPTATPRPPCPDLVGLNDTAHTAVMSGAPPEHAAWNNRYGWRSKFVLTLDRKLCQARARILVRLNCVTTEAQRDALAAAVTAKWSNKFKICCKDDPCCPAYTVHVDLKVVGEGDIRYVVQCVPRTQHMTAWDPNDTRDVPHEVGHMLGNPDEYFTVDGTAFGTPRAAGGTIMNNPERDPVERHYEQIRKKTVAMLGVPDNKCVIKKVTDACP